MVLHALFSAVFCLMRKTYNTCLSCLELVLSLWPALTSKYLSPDSKIFYIEKTLYKPSFVMFLYLWSYQNNNPALYILDLVFTITHSNKSFLFVIPWTHQLMLLLVWLFICVSSCGFWKFCPVHSAFKCCHHFSITELI